MPHPPRLPSQRHQRALRSLQHRHCSPARRYFHLGQKRRVGGLGCAEAHVGRGGLGGAGAGTEMSQLVCGGCRTLLVYIRGASSVQCSCCHTVNLSMETGQVAHINCGGCGMTLMYAFGAQSVKCAICQFVSNVSVGQTRMPLPMQRPPFPTPPPPQPQAVSCIPMDRWQSQE